MNDRNALRKMLDFVRETRWETMTPEVRAQAKKCFFDLAAVLCAGAKNNSAQKAAAYVRHNYPTGGVTVYATGEKTNLIGAALANGMAANALDMDDGYSLLRGHPGAGFFGALLSAAESVPCTYGDVLAALTVAYELSIREGYAIRDFYGWDHSSGSYSAFGTAGAVGKLLGLSDDELEKALSIADFILPVVPAKRSTYLPSMNKDGIYWGQHAGMQAVVMAKSGISGRNPVILDDTYVPYIDTLGKTYYFFDLYIKFYSCCRWAHSPIRAVAGLMQENGIPAERIESIDIYTFGNAGTLYQQAPTNEDEAQYNILYPIAAQVVFGDCSPLESSTEKMLDARIAPMIERIHFHREPEYDKVFPAKRFCRAEITLTDGTTVISDPCEPLGDRNAEVTMEMLTEKAWKINGIYASPETVEAFVRAALDTPAEAPFSTVLDAIRKLAGENLHPEIRHI